MRRASIAAEATVMEHEHEFTYQDVERLCRRHLADRSLIDLTGPHIVRYEPQETQKLRPAFPHVSALLLERVDFDRAFAKLDKRHQQVLIAWYALDREKAVRYLMDTWKRSQKTILRKRTEAIHALKDIMNGEGCL